MIFRATTRLFLLLLLLPALLVACDSANEEEPVDIPPPREVAEADFIVTETGLKYFDFEVGTGPLAETGDQLLVNYNGWLTNGRLFDSSVLRGEPISFVLGANRVIPGWEEGLEGMRVGGNRQLVIPPALAYGPFGSGVIPPNATLIFEVELVGIL